MRFPLVVLVLCTCTVLITAHQYPGRKGNDKDDDYNDDDGRCRCASFCAPDEYQAGVCMASWWRTINCCRYRTCGPCQCTIAFCGQEEVHVGYCADNSRKCCLRCRRHRD